MKKFFGSILLMIFVVGCHAQNTIVSATVTDSDGNVWANASYTITFNNPSQGQPPVYTGTAIKIQTIFKGTLDNSGVLNVTIPDNLRVQPRGTWNFELCSNTSAACSYVTSVTVTGSSQNLTSLLSASVIAPRFNCVNTCHGYSTAEVLTPVTPASIFYDVTPGVSQTCYQSNGSTWVNCGGSGGSGNMSDGSGTSTATQFLESTTTPHTYNVVTAAQALSDLGGAKSLGDVIPETTAFNFSTTGNADYACTSASAVTGTLPASPPTGVHYLLRAEGAGNCSLSSGTSNINWGTTTTASSVLLHQGQSVSIGWGSDSLWHVTFPPYIQPAPYGITVPATAIGAGVCNTPTSVTINNASSTSEITFTPQSDVSGVTGWGPASPGLYFVPYGSTNSVTYKVCNGSTASITPSAATTWTIHVRIP